MQIVRQKIRFLILLASLILFPITIFYLSPVLLYKGIVHSVININILLFIGQMILSMFFGRIFCGWICPGSALSDICIVLNKRPIKTRYSWIKYIVWFPWFVSIILILLLSSKPIVVDAFYGMKTSVSILEHGGLIVYFSFVGIIILLSAIVGRHSFCHHVCWMAPFMVFGIKLSQLFRIPRLELHFNQSKCNQCGTCSQKCPMSIDIHKTKGNTISVNTNCTLCAECISACKKKALEMKISIN